ncbi:hypothetical protein D9758_009482 [Tetrapyrgos nigripes]|uniref:Uncharacterized protein n=1 Tax=Tetrapyrgos nigripes TaxID=182062 RepID=A0A8H5G153_9AGAR|nr:hypothetical protein D9758_009482 [Tetrapyrgos nigripes]
MNVVPTAGIGIEAMNSTVSNAPSGDPPIPALIYIYNALTFLGFFSLLALLITAWTVSSIHRSVTWYAFLLSWVAFCIANALLLGHQFDSNPEFDLCLTQAALIYAVPALTAYSSLAMTLQLSLSVAALLKDGSNLQGRIIYLLLTLPPGIAAIVLIEALIYGLERTDSVARSGSGMICRITDGIPLKVTAVLVILAMLATIIVEAFTFGTLYRSWAAFRKLKRSQLQKSGVSLFTIIRLSIFSLLPMLALGLSVQASFQTDDNSLVDAHIYIVTEALPLAAGLIFATHKDILEVWTSWCRKKKLPCEQKEVKHRMQGQYTSPEIV